MTRDVHDALASHTEDFRVVSELHRIRPHATYEVQFEGRRAVCKLATDPEADVRAEARTIEFVREETLLPVPEVLAVGNYHFVAAWLDGLPTDPALDRARIEAMGRGLARLHDETADRFDATGHLREVSGGIDLDDPGPWSETLCALLRDRREYLADRGYAELAEEVLAFLREHADTFDAIRDAVLVHGNWLPEHVGVDGGEVVGVIDFEHALVGSPEWDYLRAVVPLFSGEPDHGVPESAFREAYEAVRPLPAGFDDRREAYLVVLYVSYMKALYLQRGPLDPPDEIEERAERIAERTRELLHELRG